MHVPDRRRVPAGRGVVDVAVGVLRLPDGRVLLAERRAHQDGAGYWELPGGKIDPGESAAEAAARELHEEVGVEVDSLVPWRVYEYVFPTKHLRLHWFHVTRWRGQPHGKEGQRLAWVDPARPDVGPVLASNEKALATLGLPAVVGVARVERGPGAPDRLVAQVSRLAANGLRLLVVCAPGLACAQRVQLARRLGQASRDTGLRIMLSGTALEAQRGGACGVHSSSAALAAATQRPAVTMWGVSVHGPTDLARAAALDADFAFASPVFPTPTDPGRDPLGWDGLRMLTSMTSMPVYAQGDLSLQDLGAARDAGALGVAVEVATVVGSRAPAQAS